MHLFVSATPSGSNGGAATFARRESGARRGEIGASASPSHRIGVTGRSRGDIACFAVESGLTSLRTGLLAVLGAKDATRSFQLQDLYHPLSTGEMIHHAKPLPADDLLPSAI